MSTVLYSTENIVSTSTVLYSNNVNKKVTAILIDTYMYIKIFSKFKIFAII